MKTIHTTKDISTDLEQVLNSAHDLNAKLVAQMHAGVCHFFFQKKDGSVREAYGTLCKPILEAFLGPQEEETQPTEPVPNSDATLQRFYDIKAMGFRSFTISSLIAMF